MPELTEFDIQVLKVLNGEEVEGMVWGAAMAVSASFLKKIGFASGFYDITDKGRDYLKSLDTPL